MERKETLISQSHYIARVLSKFTMQNCNTLQTPFDSNLILSVKDCPDSDLEKLEMKNVPFRSCR